MGVIIKKDDNDRLRYIAIKGRNLPTCETEEELKSLIEKGKTFEAQLSDIVTSEGRAFSR